jgi:hypothetical protein
MKGGTAHSYARPLYCVLYEISEDLNSFFWDNYRELSENPELLILVGHICAEVNYLVLVVENTYLGELECATT